MTGPRPLLALAVLALAAAPVRAQQGGPRYDGTPLPAPVSPAGTDETLGDSPKGGSVMPVGKSVPTSPTIPQPTAPTGGGTASGGTTSGGTTSGGTTSGGTTSGGTTSGGAVSGPAPMDTGGVVGAPTDLGGSSPAAAPPTLVAQPPVTSGGSGSSGKTAPPTGGPLVAPPTPTPAPATSGSDLTGTINSLAGRLASLIGSRPDTSAFNGVPKIQAPARASAPPDGTAGSSQRFAGESAGGAAAGGGSLSAFDPARGSRQAPEGGALALDKMVGEIASVGDSRNANQKQSAAALQRAKTQMALKDFMGALRSLDQAVRFDPDNIEALIQRAAVESKLKRYDDALADAKEAIRRDPKNAAAWDQAAWANFKAGRYQDAIDAATRALFLNPNDAVALAIRARARWAMGDRAGALADARAAARLDARFAKLAEAMARGAYADDGELLADDASQVQAPLERSLPWTALLGLAALLLAALGGLAAYLTRNKQAKVRTFSSLAHPSNGRLAGKYELRSLLGKGGMGSVHEAFDHTLKRTVAIKKMAEGLTEVNPKAKELLVREAQTVAALRHPNIVDIYEIVDEAGDLYLVFELVRGKTVSQLLAEKGALPLERCAEILKPVCQALQLAHKSELVHRDLKPGNIMLTDDGFVKLMDFGIARQTGAAAVEPGRTAAAEREIPMLARTKMVMGTPRYMAPEMEYGVVSKQGDVYALGVCLYEMLTGRFPFETNAEKLELRFEPPSAFVPGLTKRVDALLREALDPDPAKRIRTPMIFYGRLFAALQPGGTPPAPVPAR